MQSIQPGMPAATSPVPTHGVGSGTQPIAAAEVAAASTTAPQAAPPKIDSDAMRKNLQEAIDRINAMVRDGGRALHFSFDDKMKTPVIVVRNQESGEVIRQIPSETVVKMAHSMEDLKGLLYNEIT